MRVFPGNSHRFSNSKTGWPGLSTGLLACIVGRVALPRSRPSLPGVLAQCCACPSTPQPVVSPVFWLLLVGAFHSASHAITGTFLQPHHCFLQLRERNGIFAAGKLAGLETEQTIFDNG